MWKVEKENEVCTTKQKFWHVDSLELKEIKYILKGKVTTIKICIQFNFNAILEKRFVTYFCIVKKQFTQSLSNKL